MNATRSQRYNVSRVGRANGRRSGPFSGPEYDWLHIDGDDTDYGLKPTPLFPDADIPPPAPLSSQEQDQIKHHLALRKRIHDGPIYANIGNTEDIERYATFEAAQVDPFEGAPTYSSIYKKKKRTLPDLTTRTYDKRFFPRELWPILGIKSTPLPNGTQASKKRKPVGDNVEGEAADPPRKRARLRRMNRIIEDDENEENDENKDDAQGGEEDLSKAVDDSDDEQEVEEEVPDEFSDDENDDYNAERYFENGNDDYDDGGDDGDQYNDTF